MSTNKQPMCQLRCPAMGGYQALHVNMNGLGANWQ